MEFDFNSVVHRQNLFMSTLKSHFLRKITKYQNILLKNGIYLSEQTCNHDDVLPEPRSQCFDDHIELVIGQKSGSPNACKTLWKIGNRISTLKLFRWIYLIVQRTKAVRILHHLDGIADSEVQAVVQSVGEEIAVAFEYQLCVLEGDIEVIGLAHHAAACILTYLNSADAHFAPENLLQAILEIKPQNGANKEILKTRSLHFNGEPVYHKWRLSQILKQPGLRIVTEDEPEVVENQDLSKDKEQQGSSDTQNAYKRLCITDTRELVTTEESATDRNADSNDIEIKDTSELKEEETEGATTKEIETDSEKCLSDQTDQVHNRKFRRTISAIDMDFDKGEMKVTEYSVEVSDFSPVGNDTSQYEDGEHTSPEESLESEDDSGEPIRSINYTYKTPCHDSNVSTVSGTCKRRHGNEIDLHRRITSVSAANTVTNDDLNRNKSDSADVLQTRMCNKQNDRGSFDTFLSVSSEKSDAYKEIQAVADTNNVNVRQDNKPEISTQQATLNISAHRYIQDTSIHPVEYISQDFSTSQTSFSKPVEYFPLTQLTKQDQNSGCLNDRQGLRVNGNEIHIRSIEHITSNTYQICQEQNNDNVTDEAVPLNCSNDLLDEITRDEKSYSFYGCFTPYGARCRPQIYGYRGPLHVWNEKNKRYTPIYNDIVSVTRKHQRQIPRCPRDIHQAYIPKTVCRH